MELLEHRRRPQKDFVHMMLSADHARLDHLFEDIVASARAGDPGALRAEWRRFEAELTSHLELEEQELLPAFARQHPAEAQGLREEHERIRGMLAELGVALDLHCLRADRVEEFVTLVRAHARREEALLYPWASRTSD
jgi:hemerythrin superfamily protein